MIENCYKLPKASELISPWIVFASANLPGIASCLPMPFSLEPADSKLPGLTGTLSKSPGSHAGAYLSAWTPNIIFPCQISDIPILWRYGWLCLIIESRLLLETFYKINYLINTCADKTAFSQQTFVIKTHHCIQ